LIFCFLLVLGLLYAINDGYNGLRKRDQAKAAELVEKTESQQVLPKAATSTSRLSRETERVAGSLYRYASLPFEIASLLLLVAIIGSVMLARTLRQEAAADDVAPEVLQAESVYDPELVKLEAGQTE
jgi:hypothetical protein